MQAALGRYKYEDLTAFKGVVVIPYQCSIMSIFEYYRMGIPMIVPSLDLLTSWHMEWRCGTAHTTRRTRRTRICNAHHDTHRTRS